MIHALGKYLAQAVDGSAGMLGEISGQVVLEFVGDDAAVTQQFVQLRDRDFNHGGALGLELLQRLVNDLNHLHVLGGVSK
ncbi:hypothetical protein D3C76_1065140 [compost metagenome]